MANSTDATIALADYYLVTERFDDAREILNELANDKEAYSAAMLRLAATLPGGQAANIGWTHAKAEDATLDAPVDLMVAGASIPRDRPPRLRYWRNGTRPLGCPSGKALFFR